MQKGHESPGIISTGSKYRTRKKIKASLIGAKNEEEDDRGRSGADRTLKATIKT